MQNSILGALCAATVSLAALPALAHATLETTEAPAGAPYKAVIRIGHGCDGQPTDTLRVTLPEGFYNAKPMPKADWALETVKGPYATPYDNHGTTMTEGTRQVIWSGGDLQDDWYDEFVIRGTIGKDVAPGTALYFATQQECGTDKADWTDVSGNADVPNPAPSVTVTEAKASGHGGHAPAPVVLGALQISGAYARATPPGAPVGGAFMTIANSGAEDRLTAVRAPALTDDAQIHEMAMQGEVMQMRALPDGLAVPAGGSVELKPGGYHIMFMQLKKPLVAGETVPVTLEFEHAGAVEVPLTVQPLVGGKDDAKGGEHAGH